MKPLVKQKKKPLHQEEKGTLSQTSHDGAAEFAIHAPCEALLCADCHAAGYCFFDFGCAGCVEALERPETSVNELYCFSVLYVDPS